jgi:YHS domain-containing protein
MNNEPSASEQRLIMTSTTMKTFNSMLGQGFEIDPVCAMKVDPQNPPFKVIYEGRIYCFCSGACKYIFERMPEKYISKKEA